MCFDQRSVSVVEGEKVELILATSKRLSGYVRVDLIYSNGTGYPAICHPAPLGELCVIIICINLQFTYCLIHIVQNVYLTF